MNVVWLALPIIAGFGLLSWMVVWSRADTWARPAAVALFIASIPVVAYAGVEALGRHKPITLDRLAAGDYHVLAAVLQQDKAIYVYLIDPARDEPRPLYMPWSNEDAQAIQDALDGAPEGSEGQLKMQYQHDGVTGIAEFHPLPQPPSPPAKEAPEPGLVFEQD
jgi:hypothetical protein